MAKVKVVITVMDRVAAERLLELLPDLLHKKGFHPAEIRVVEE